jgi:flagellar motility protein MotE (MotC chaperone)
MSDSPSPTLNPFPTEESSSSGSNWGIVIAAIILGIATAAGVLLWRMPSIGSEKPAAAAPSSSANSASEQPANFIDASHSKIFSQSKNWDFFTRELENYVNELHKDREAIAAQSKDLGAAELRIKAEKEELVRIRKEIESMRTQLETLTTELTEVEKVNLANIAKTYSKMPPDKAVAIFSEMTENNSVKILALMKADVSAKILGQMAETKESSDSDSTLASKAAALTNRLRLYKQDDFE